MRARHSTKAIENLTALPKDSMRRRAKPLMQRMIPQTRIPFWHAQKRQPPGTLHARQDYFESVLLVPAGRPHSSATATSGAVDLSRRRTRIAGNSDGHDARSWWPTFLASSNAASPNRCSTGHSSRRVPHKSRDRVRQDTPVPHATVRKTAASPRGFRATTPHVLCLPARHKRRGRGPVDPSPPRICASTIRRRRL